MTARQSEATELSIRYRQPLPGAVNVAVFAPPIDLQQPDVHSLQVACDTRQPHEVVVSLTLPGFEQIHHGAVAAQQLPADRTAVARPPL